MTLKTQFLLRQKRRKVRVEIGLSHGIFRTSCNCEASLRGGSGAIEPVGSAKSQPTPCEYLLNHGCFAGYQQRRKK